MKIGGEEVELVTSFEELRAGLIVWLKPCLRCGGNHRGILVGAYRGLAQDALTGDISNALGLWMLPPPACANPPGMIIGPVTVGRLTVYAVVGQLPLATKTTSKPRSLANGPRV